MAIEETQRKITSTWKLIPEHEKRNLIKEEEKRKLLELRDIKVNIWKKWRRETEEKKAETERNQKNNQERWLEKLEETLARMKREVEEKKRAKIAIEARRKKLIEEKKFKQEELLRKDQERKERKQKKRMMEERWAMTRWLTKYISENNDRWKREKEERNQDEKERAESWKKMNRLEKIRLLKEKITEKAAHSKIKAIIQPARLEHRDDHPPKQDHVRDDHHQQQVQEWDVPGDPLQRPHGQVGDDPHHQQDHAGAGDVPHDDVHQPGQDDVHTPCSPGHETQSCQSTLHTKTLQPLTILRELQVC